jgi:hypothetical protein
VCVGVWREEARSAALMVMMGYQVISQVGVIRVHELCGFRKEVMGHKVSTQ